jgi:hypothetical protein
MRPPRHLPNYGPVPRRKVSRPGHQRHRYTGFGRNEAEWRDTVRFWKSSGVTRLTLAAYSGRGHLRRIPGKSLSDHLSAIKRYWNAVADLFWGGL